MLSLGRFPLVYSVPAEAKLNVFGLKTAATSLPNVCFGYVTAHLICNTRTIETVPVKYPKRKCTYCSGARPLAVAACHVILPHVYKTLDSESL